MLQTFLRRGILPQRRAWSQSSRPVACLSGALWKNNCGQSSHFVGVHRSTSSYSSSNISSREKEGVAKAAASGEKNEEKPAPRSKLVTLWRQYGAVAVTTYFGIYFSSIGGLYWAFNSGLLSFSDLPVAVVGDNADSADVFSMIVHKYNIDDYIDTSTISPSMGNFALAWLTTKLIEPLRAIVTIAIVPSIARKLGKAPAKVV